MGGERGGRGWTPTLPYSVVCVVKQMMLVGTPTLDISQLRVYTHVYPVH